MVMMRKLFFLNTSYIQKQLLLIICSHGQKMVNVLKKKKKQKQKKEILIFLWFWPFLQLSFVIFWIKDFLGGLIKCLYLDSEMNH